MLSLRLRLILCEVKGVFVCVCVLEARLEQRFESRSIPFI